MAVPRPRRGRPAWRIHAAVGLWTAAILAVVCFTGTIATVSHELVWLCSGINRATITAEPVSVGARWDAAQAAYPGMRPTSLSTTGTASSVEAYLATAIHGIDRDGSRITVYVDPGTGLVNGAVRGVTFPSLMRALHYYLLDPFSATVVFYLLACEGVLMGVMAVTGIAVYAGWWRGFTRLPQPHKPARIWWGQLHRLLAVWSLPFLLVIWLTVCWYLLEWDDWVDWNQWGTDITNATALPPGSVIRGGDIDRWAGIADREMPGLRVTAIIVPHAPGAPVLVNGQWQAVLVRERANAVQLDPVTGAVLHRSVAHDMPVSERWTHTADPLHMGDFYGLWSKLCWVLFGLALTALCVSGMVVCYRRLLIADAADRAVSP